MLKQVFNALDKGGCSDTPGHRQRCGGFTWLRHATDPSIARFFKNFRKFFSIFRVFVNAVRVQNFFGTSGSSRSVCCQSFSSVRRLEATKTPKNRNEKKCKLWTGVYPPRIAPFGLKLWENAFQTIPDISFFDATKLFFDKNFRQKKIATPKISKISKVPVLEEL